MVFTILLLFTGCSNIKGVFGKNSKNETVAKEKVESVQKAQSINVQYKMDQVAILASGTDYALTKVTNRELPVSVAYDINKRVMSLSGKPDLDAEKEIWKTVDQLISDLSKERERGIKSMEEKDSEIQKLQTESRSLSTLKDVEIDKYIKLANTTAMKADTLKASLDEMDSWFGLGAVWYGLKKLVFTGVWVIVGILVIFTILRFASLSNPIAASIFNIFESIGSWFINTTLVLLPKSLDKAGHISKVAYDELEGILSKIVDDIQNIKQIEVRTGKPITLKELLVELDKSMDQSQKDAIDKIKKELGY